MKKIMKTNYRIAAIHLMHLTTFWPQQVGGIKIGKIFNGLIYSRVGFGLAFRNPSLGR